MKTNYFHANYCHLHDWSVQWIHCITSEKLAHEQQNTNCSIDLANSMKQHMIVFIPHGEISYKEYLCDCTSCLQFRFSDCFHDQNTSEVASPMDEFTSNDDNEDDVDDQYIDRSQQMFNFVDVPSCISLIGGNAVEPLYFVKLIEKVVAEEIISDPYNHFICKGERYFKGQYLKLTRSRNLNYYKLFQVLPTYVVISPDEIYNTYIDINDNMQLNVNVYNALVRKAMQ
jgi:hypothetical protein